MDRIVWLPVIVSARYRIVINSSLRRTIHVSETDRVKLLSCRNSLQIFNSSTSLPGAQKKNISAGRFNLPMDWAKKNGIEVGDHVFLIATSDCILVRPSVSKSAFGRKEVLQ